MIPWLLKQTKTTLLNKSEQYYILKWFVKFELKTFQQDEVIGKENIQNKDNQQKIGKAAFSHH